MASPPLTSVGGSGGTPAQSGGSDSGGSSLGGSGGTLEPTDPCEDADITCITVPNAGPYGTKTFSVPAFQNWVNTGLYLEEGETATITESGEWSLQSEGEGIDHGPCLTGDLVARIGLNYKDSSLTCVSGSAVFTAPRAGILFLGALAGNDLGETYETRFGSEGEKTVSVESTGNTVPTVQGAEAEAYDFNGVASGWVEVWGKHVILTLPANIAQQDREVLLRATERLDEIYELEESLRGAVPHRGQRIRFFPDGTQPGYMLAGNPVRMAFELVEGGDQTRISRSGEEGTGVWGFAHELGHDFSFAPSGFWTYQDGSKSLESWPNIFSVHALQALDLPLNESALDCTTSSSGDFDNWDAWGGLCFLRQFQLRCGFDFYETFFADINDETNLGGLSTWEYVHDKFVATANLACSDAGDMAVDVSALFDAWGVPR